MRARRTLTQRVDKVLVALKRQQRKAHALPEWQEVERIHQYHLLALFRKIAVFGESLSGSESERQARYKAIDEEINALKTPEDRAAERRFRTKYGGQIDGARELLLQKLSAMRDAIRRHRKEKGMMDDEDQQEEF